MACASLNLPVNMVNVLFPTQEQKAGTGQQKTFSRFSFVKTHRTSTSVLESCPQSVSCIVNSFGSF